METAYSTISGGTDNFVVGYAGNVGGGEDNTAYGAYSSVTGGDTNRAMGARSGIGGGSLNYAYGFGSTVVGGSANEVYSYRGIIAGGGKNKIFSSATYATIAGGYLNSAYGTESYVAGSSGVASYANSAAFAFNGATKCFTKKVNSVNFCTVNKGLYHNGVRLTALDETNYVLENKFNVLKGGQFNTVSGSYSTVYGGRANYGNAKFASVMGGFKNRVFSNYGTILSGFMNQVSGRFGTVLGGSRNYARGRYSVAAGFKANAYGDYSMTLGYSGEQCDNDNNHTMAICAESLSLNGNDVGQTLEYMDTRALAEEGAGGGDLDMLAADWNRAAVKVEEHGKLIAEHQKRNEAQDQFHVQQEKAMAEVQQLLALAQGLSTAAA